MVFSNDAEPFESIGIASGGSSHHESCTEMLDSMANEGPHRLEFTCSCTSRLSPSILDNHDKFQRMCQFGKQETEKQELAEEIIVNVCVVTMHAQTI